jgi:biopolymer transport protein ExbD
MRVRRLHKKPAELEIIAFINLIVVLVPFLLSVAVFSRLAVIDISLPAPSDGALAQLQADTLQLEVVIRADAFEVGDRVGGLIQRIERPAAGATTPATEPDRAALDTLAVLLLQIKARYPTQKEATVLAETDTPYDTLVQVMDTLRAGAPAAPGTVAPATPVELFPQLAVGDAPLRNTAAVGTAKSAAKAGGA